jgi:hypothetical protein
VLNAPPTSLPRNGHVVPTRIAETIRDWTAGLPSISRRMSSGEDERARNGRRALGRVLVVVLDIGSTRRERHLESLRERASVAGKPATNRPT